MILTPRDVAWNQRVTRKAHELGWTVFEQVQRNQRPHEPSLVLTQLDRIALVWLRTNKPRPARRPPMERYAVGGAEVYLWTPPDWHEVCAVLLPNPPGGSGAFAAAA